MWRALVFLGLVAVAASGAVWLADRPGELVVTWGNLRVQTTVAVAAITVVSLAVVLALLWTITRFLIDLPDRLRHSSRARRRSRGYRAVSRGMIAVGAGDPTAARRYAAEAGRLLGREPLALLLRAQAAQIVGDRAAAETAFRRMLDGSETRVLGLRGLFVEAKRRGDLAPARDYAAEAARLAPAASWANEAVIEAHAAEGDWKGALAVVERRSALGLLDKKTARRERAVLLAALAQSQAEANPEAALAAALDAVRLAPGLVPAAALAGRLLSRRGDLRRGARVIEAAWKAEPHPELAEVYLNLRPGDSALDRLARAETLAKLSSWDPEARLALAGAALEAREFKRARDTLAPVLEDRPTVRACMLMAEIEQAEHGSTGRVREWLARAARAPRDPAWIADGTVFDHWSPISPISGRLDAFVWQPPPDLIGGAGPGLLLDEGDGEPPQEPSSPAIPSPEQAVSRPNQSSPAAAARSEAAEAGALAESTPAEPAAPAEAPTAPNGSAASAPAESSPVPPQEAGREGAEVGSDAPTKKGEAPAPAPLALPAPDDRSPNRDQAKRVAVQVSS